MRRVPRPLLVTLTAFLLLLCPFAAGQQAQAHPVLEGLNGPIDFAVLSDGTIWWNEYYTGNTLRYDPATDSKEVLFHTDPIEDGVERGLVGLAVSDASAAQGTFWVYYTVADEADPDGGTNRLSRIDGGEETVLLEVPAFTLHNGGRIEFGPDDTLFVATGDNMRAHLAQDADSYLGKILHVDYDGEPVGASAVHSLGHRNVYGLAYDTASDRLFATENSNAERDEVNLIEAGSNYGWPHCEGYMRYDQDKGRSTDEPCHDPEFTAPIGEFYPSSTTAPAGATIFRGELYWGAWNQGHIHRLVEDPGSGYWKDTIVFSAGGGRVNDVDSSPDGQKLFYSNWTGIFWVDMPAAPATVADPPEEPVTAPIQTASTPQGAGSTEPPEEETPPPALAMVLSLLAAALVARRARR